MKSHVVALLLILSCSVLAATVQSAGAEKDVPNHVHDKKIIGPKLVTSFHYGNQSRKVEAPQIATFSQNGGTVNCNALVTTDKPCGGLGQYDMNSTFLYTTVDGPEPLWFLFCPSSCLKVTWTTAGYRPTIDIGGQTYNWSYGTMLPCTDMDFCAEPVTWKDQKGKSVDIDNTLANVPITIIASYYYTSQTGNTVKEVIYHNMMHGYG